AIDAGLDVRVPDHEELELRIVVAQEAPRRQLHVHAGGVRFLPGAADGTRRARPAGVDRADARLLEDAALDAGRREILARDLQPSLAVEERFAAGPDLIEAELVAADLTREPGSVPDRHLSAAVQTDPPREKRIGAAPGRELE